MKRGEQAKLIRELKIMCTGEIKVDFHDLKDLQLTESGQSLKATSQEKIDKLAASLKEYGIVNNLQVWKDGKTIYCFDAHHRKKALSQLENEGLKIPLLPATRCLAKDIKEAKKLLLLKESSNSWIDTGVIEDYLSDIEFDIEEAKALIEIPDFEWPSENDKNKNDPDKLPNETEKVVIKKKDLIELGKHRLLCGDSTDTKQVNILMGSEKWDCLIFDPPYEVEELYSGIPQYKFGKLVVFWDFKRFALAPSKAIESGWAPQYEFIWDNITSWYTPNRPLMRHKACGVFCDDPFFDTEKAIIYDGKDRKAKTVHNTRGSSDYKPLKGAKHISTVEQFQNTKVEGDHAHAKPMGWISAIYNGLSCFHFLICLAVPVQL